MPNSGWSTGNNLTDFSLFDRVKQTLEMQLPDGPSSDAPAGEHGREVYRDDNNNVDIQMQRLVRLQHLAQREIEAGWQPPAL